MLKKAKREPKIGVNIDILNDLKLLKGELKQDTPMK